MDEVTRTTVNGVFWIVEDKLLAFPFRKGIHSHGIAKSGNTYNHEKLWEELKISSKPFDYYPRGRVHVSDAGRVTIYISPHIDKDRWMSEIKTAFDIVGNSFQIREDHSRHYRCHLDDGWQPAKAD